MAYDWMSQWTNPGGFNAQGGLLGNPYAYMGDIGAGLLANSGPTLAPHPTGGAAFGQAVLGANQNAQERMKSGYENEVKRAALLQNQQQQAAEQEMRAAIATGDVNAIKAATVKAYPEVFAKSLFPSADAATTEAKLAELGVKMDKYELQAQGQQIQNVGARVSNENYLDASQNAVNAVNWIKQNFPDRADSIISSGANTGLMRALNNYGVGKIVPAEIAGGDPKKIPELIDRMEAIQKARKFISIGLANNQQGVVGLQTAGESLGEGAGAAVNLHQFENAVRSGKRIAELNKWELPPGITVPEAEAAGVDVKGAGKPASEIKPPQGTPQFTPQGGVTYSDPSQSKYTPLPTPPAAAPTNVAPPIRPTGTLNLNPQGQAVFQRQADFERAKANGLLTANGVTSVIVNGEIYDLVPGG